MLLKCYWCYQARGGGHRLEKSRRHFQKSRRRFEKSRRRFSVAYSALKKVNICRKPSGAPLFSMSHFAPRGMRQIEKSGSTSSTNSSTNGSTNDRPGSTFQRPPCTHNQQFFSLLQLSVARVAPSFVHEVFQPSLPTSAVARAKYLQPGTSSAKKINNTADDPVGIFPTLRRPFPLPHSR